MSAPTIRVPKGTRDLSGAEMAAFSRLEETARRVFTLHGFRELRTPIFEHVELFSRSLGETSDVVEKEMFVFTDRGERTFALRPEGTAGVVRHFIEENLFAQGGLHRLFYTGPMFRAERPQAGRYRQFFQAGSEYFGAADPAADADTVVMVSRIFREFGLPNISVHVNSLGCPSCRPRHREALLGYLKERENDLSEESRRRMNVNPLRVLDSKVDGPKLSDAPAMEAYLCDACRRHHDVFLSLVGAAAAKGLCCPVIPNPKLVRGLDYYTRTVFEFVSPDLGAQSAVAAGGRYDHLVESLGGPSVPGVGFAMGVDRAVSIYLQLKTDAPAVSAFDAVIIPLDDDSVSPAFEAAGALRAAGMAVPPVTPGKKLKNQLSAASDGGAKWAVLIGEDERKSGNATVKNLATRDQSSVPFADLPSRLSRPA